MEIISAIEEWVVAAAGQPWVLLVVFALCFIDGFFPPLPSESIVITMATLAMTGVGQPLWAVILATALGALAGDCVAYLIGRTVPFRTLPYLRSERGAALIRGAERQLTKRGGTYIIAARYIPVGRMLVNMSAGMVGFPFRRFVAFDAIGATLWALYSVAIGTVSGALFGSSPLVAIVVGVAGGIALGVVIDRVLRAVGVAPAELQPRTAQAAPRG
ncbi:DedA family protein [Serinibacter salmoneus]|uniref:DedA family protein n=1 Tax=Serinibacter salmoneus TaxID=556530 RepID=UPI000BF5B022|nr:DedA family protein [Serinibacter salmoneus]